MATMMEKARSHVVLDHPFFASVLLKHPMRVDNSMESISISFKGEISYNEKFFEALPVKQAVFDLCHEVLHYVSKHALRRGVRDHEMWNKACDAWINGTLTEMGIGEPNPGVFTMPDAHNSTPEKLYEILLQEEQKKPDNNGQGKGSGQGKVGAGGGSGDPLAGDIEAPPQGTSESEIAEQDAQTNMELAAAAQAAKMRGNLPGLLQKLVSDTIDSRVPWYETLERFMVNKVQNDYSWSRANRRYLPMDVYLPVIQSIGTMGPIVVQVDVSGSISKKELDHYNGHLQRIVELCSPSEVHVIYTDTRVVKHETFERGEEFGLTFYSGGGTDMRSGFEFIRREGIEPDVVITLTDGYTPFPEQETDYPAIWCISSDQKSPTGENIHFSLEG